MKKIKDRIILGLVTSALSGVPGRLINAWEYEKGYTDIKYGQMAASLFPPKNQKNTPEVKVIGAVTNQINTAMAAIAVTYLLSATGRDKAIVKGMGVLATTWVGIYGLTSRLGITVNNKKPLAHLLSLKDHLIFGGLCGLIASTLGDDSLFPDSKETSKRKKIPIIATNTEPEIFTAHDDQCTEYTH